MIQLAAIATALTEIITLGYKIWGLFQESKQKGWVDNAQLITQQINGATTDEARADLAKRLFDNGAL
jgi:hypothetical protein